MFHRHKWSQWKQWEAEIGSIFGDYEALVQIRKCTTCGKMQWTEL